MQCKLCKGPVVQREWGWGEWYVSPYTNAERGPYCSEVCLSAARETEVLGDA